MPKVSRVGKFRRQAKEDAVAAAAVVTEAPTSSVAVASVSEVENADIKTENKDASNDTSKTASPSVDQLSRGQRKRQAKRDQYLKRELMIMSTLKLKHQEEQKKRLDGLDALKEALMDVAKTSAAEAVAPDEPAKAVSMLKSNKSKKELTMREVTHLNLVLQHPTFQANPMETMQEHLRNTLAKSAKLQSVQAKQREQEDKAKQEVKRQQKKDKMKEVHKGRKKFKAGRTKSKSR